MYTYNKRRTNPKTGAIYYNGPEEVYEIGDLVLYDLELRNPNTKYEGIWEITEVFVTEGGNLAYKLKQDNRKIDVYAQSVKIMFTK
jgi:hypothetical protein